MTVQRQGLPSLECCRRVGDKIEVPSIWGDLSVVFEANGLLIVKEAGRSARLGARHRQYLKGRYLLAKIRPFQAGDMVLSSYHLRTYDFMVFEVLDVQPLTKAALERMKAAI